MGDATRDAVDRDAVRELGLRYARGIDSRNVDLLASAFTDQAFLKAQLGAHGPGGAAIATRIIAGHTATYDRTYHFVGNQHVEVDGDTAQGETYCTAYHWFTKDGTHYERVMYIRYQDTAVRRDGEWRFEHRELEIDRVYTYPIPADGPAIPPISK